MHVKTLGFCLILALLGQFASAADCDGVLRAVNGISLNINIEISFDPHTNRPVARFVQPPPAPAPAPIYRRERTAHVPDTSLGNYFHRLMNGGALIQQNAWSLGQRALLVENGGLCGTTCGVNVLSAVTEYTQGDSRVFRGRAGAYIHEMLKFVFDTEGADARYGITLTQLRRAMENLARRMGLGISMTEHLPHFKPLRLADLSMAENELLIVSVRSSTRKGKPGHHAVVITGVDPVRGRASFSDPNRPNQGGQIDVRDAVDEFGNQTVRFYLPLDEQTPYSGVVSDVLRIKVNR